MSKRKGLIPVKRMVVRNNKPFMQTVYIKPKHRNKVESKQIKIPEWDFTNSYDFANEVNRINSIEDRSERRIVKEALLEHVEKVMKVKYDKVPETEDRAYARNTMRAFSAAKKHLKDNPKPEKKKTSTKNKQGYIITKVPGDSYLMERDVSKRIARDFRDKVGKENVIPILRENGITWNEVDDPGPNHMRAMRALASFMRKGGELGEETESKKEVKLVLDNPGKQLKESKYEKDSIQYDYELATPKQKLIGLATGVMPVDTESTKFLESRIAEGKFGFLEDIDESNDYGLPKKLNKHLNTVSELLTDFYDTRVLSNLTSFTFNEHGQIFKGTEHEKDYNKVEESFKEFYKKWGSSHLRKNGVVGIEESVNVINKLYDIEPDWENQSGAVLYEKLSGLVSEVSKMDDKEINKFWDEYELDRSFTESEWREERGTLANLINIGVTIGTHYVFDKVANDLDVGSSKDIVQAVNSGTKSKREVLEVLAKQLEETRKVASDSKSIPKILESYRLRTLPYVRDTFKRNLERKKSFDKDKFMKEANEILSDMSGLVTPEAEYIVSNMFIKQELQYLQNRTGIVIPEYEPIPKEDWDDFRGIKETVKVHVGTLRKKTERSKQNFLKKYKRTNISYADAIKGNVDPTTLKFPDAKDIKDVIKSTVIKVPAEEAKKVEERIHKTHDKQNHNGFATKVNGVYRVKRIASEDKFQEINDDINNTGFYYHGTSIETTQKILGHTGGFKVFTDKDGGENIKAGSMLGYGIYLASNSSKSMQYVGNSFGRGTSRGVLMLCKASLGNVVESTVRKTDYNHELMDKPETDTVFMDKPSVLNPEWAVKRAEQAVPRLIIDVERIHK